MPKLVPKNMMAIEDEISFLWRGLGYKEPKKFTIRPCCITLKHVSFHIRIKGWYMAEIRLIYDRDNAETQLRYGWNAAETWLRYGKRYGWDWDRACIFQPYLGPKIWMRYDLDTAEKQIRYGWDMAEIQQRNVRDIDEIWLEIRLKYGLNMAEIHHIYCWYTA